MKRTSVIILSASIALATATLCGAKTQQSSEPSSNSDFSIESTATSLVVSTLSKRALSGHEAALEEAKSVLNEFSANNPFRVISSALNRTTFSSNDVTPYGRELARLIVSSLELTEVELCSWKKFESDGSPAEDFNAQRDRNTAVTNLEIAYDQLTRVPGLLDNQGLPRDFPHALAMLRDADTKRPQTEEALEAAIETALDCPSDHPRAGYYLIISALAGAEFQTASPIEPTHLATEPMMYPVNKGKEVDEHVAPRLCLAFSGGGTRSAAVQTGVLQGLHRHGLLDSVDIISAVSGGTYTLAWYLSKLLEADSEERVRRSFLEESSLQEEDKQRGKLIGKGEAIALAIAGPVAIPFEWHLEATVSSRQDIVSIVEGRVYASLIKAAHIEKDIRFDRFAERAATLAEIPFPVFAASAIGTQCGNFDTKKQKSDPDLLYEITPLGGGNNSSNLPQVAANHFTLSSAAAVSGAAIDTPQRSFCNLLDATKTRLGGLVCRCNNCVRLTDGAYSDNLALAPLLSRDCGAILVSDASRDPNLEFDDLITLKKWLSADGDRPRIDLDAKKEGAWFSGELTAPKPSEPSTPLVLIKLPSHADAAALAENLPDKYAVLANYLRSPHRKFPHISTLDQDLGEEEFRALRHLGMYLAEQALVEFSDQLEPRDP